MLDLAVATRAETFERMQAPLADREIRVRHVQSEARCLPLTADTPPFDEYDVGFVYPQRLMEGGVVDAFLDVPWINGPISVLTSRNKAGVIARLAEAGLAVPETVFVSDPVSEDRLEAAFERIGPPVVVKPNSTTRGVGVTVVHDLDSFLGVTDYLELLHEFPAIGDQSYLVQEYIPEATDYRLMLIDGDYVGAVKRQLPPSAVADGRWKHNVHRDASAEGVDLPTEYREIGERVAEILDIGFLGVDILETKDRLVVNETNARPTIDEATKYEPGFYDTLAALITDQIG